LRRRLGAIERIADLAEPGVEVLGTGASSIYGSDAVAGVANVILKHDYVGDTLSVRGGGAVRGGRNLTDITWRAPTARKERSSRTGC
jgi:outer membrane receptor protein involved in Fe transport